MALQEKYRPQTFDEVIGNDVEISAMATLANREDFADIPRAWLFHGPAGCGKTSLARILKDHLGCDDLSFNDYDAVTARHVDKVRQILADSKYPPMVGEIKVILFDECHWFPALSQDTLLKTLENPPKNTFFLLCTTEPEKLKKAIRSRCTHVKVATNPPKAIKTHLNWILEQEGFDDEGIESLKEVSHAISLSCGGAMRDAIKILDHVIDMIDIDDMLQVIESGVSDTEKTTDDIVKILMSKGGQQVKWKELAPILKVVEKSEAEGVRLGILGFYTAVILNTGDIHIAEIMECFENNYYDTGKSGLVLSCLQASTL